MTKPIDRDKLATMVKKHFDAAHARGALRRTIGPAGRSVAAVAQPCGGRAVTTLKTETGAWKPLSDSAPTDSASTRSSTAR